MSRKAQELGSRRESPVLHQPKESKKAELDPEPSFFYVLSPCLRLLLKALIPYAFNMTEHIFVLESHVF